MEKPNFSNLLKSMAIYRPIAVICAFSLLLSFDIDKNKQELLYSFMGYFLLIFSFLKWLDISGFVSLFRQYDIISTKFSIYPYLFPSLEFISAWCYLNMKFLLLANVVVMTIMFFNGISIGSVLIKKRKISCACLGTIANIPLSVFSLFESAAMFFMAAWML